MSALRTEIIRGLIFRTHNFVALNSLHALYPVDAYNNARRSNHPYGRVGGKVSYTSSNGAKLGKCQVSGYAGTCWELPNSLKGDLARTYFYMSTAYLGLWDCCDTAATSKWNLKPWQQALLKQWHHLDPVSKREMTRNQLIFEHYQHNRNPFIDHPEWVDLIF